MVAVKCVLVDSVAQYLIEIDYWKSCALYYQFNFCIEPKYCLFLERSTTCWITCDSVNCTLIHVVSFVLFCCRHQSWSGGIQVVQLWLWQTPKHRFRYSCRACCLVLCRSPCGSWQLSKPTMKYISNDKSSNDKQNSKMQFNIYNHSCSLSLYLLIPQSMHT